MAFYDFLDSKVYLLLDFEMVLLVGESHVNLELHFLELLFSRNAMIVAIFFYDEV